MAFSDIFEESRKKLQNYFGLGRPGLGTFGQQIKPAVNPIVNFVRQNPSPFKFAQRRIQTPQVQKTIKPAVNFFRQNPTPYSFVNRNVVKPAIDYQRNQIRIANNLANRAITGINTYADRQRQDPLYQTARKIHKYNPASWGGQIATMFAKEAARDLVRLPLQIRASITGKTIKADTPLKRAILGKDIETLGQRRQYNVGELKKYGLSDKWAGRIGTLGTGLAIAGVGLDASDIARLGGKKLLTSLAKEVDPKIIKKMLPNISDNVARKISKTKNIDEINKLLYPTARNGKIPLMKPSTLSGESMKAPSKIEIQYGHRLTPEYQEKLANMIMELDVSSAGKRHFVEDMATGQGTGLKVIGEKSSFPQWIPSDLRQRKYIDKLLESYDVDSGEFIRPKGKAGELFDVVQDRIDSQVTKKYEKIPANYERVNPEEGTPSDLNRAFGLSDIGTAAQRKGKLFETTGKKIDIIPNLRKRGKGVSEIIETGISKPVKVKVKNLADVAPKNIQDISGLDASFNTVYRNFKKAFGNKFDIIKRRVLDPFDASKGNMIREQEAIAKSLKENVVDKFKIAKGSKESALIQQYGENRISLDELKKQTPKWREIVEADNWFRKQYNTMLDEVNAVRRQIYPNNPEKIIPKRKDYYRHFQEMSGIEGIKNIFEGPSNIPTELAGVSDFTQPKSKFLSFAQKRLGGKFKDDAIGGFLDYMRASTYSKHIDPHISRFRQIADELSEIAKKSNDPDLGSRFAEYVRDFANDLSGKTNVLDRSAQKIFGRKVFNTIDWLNQRTKANVILGNLSSSVAQAGNAPQMAAKAGYSNFVAGFKDALVGNKAMQSSDFIKERYARSIFDQFDKGIMANTKKAAAWITQALDELSTKIGWNAFYRQALQKGVANPVKYADDLTRDMVAGRGVGEVALAQKSKVIQMIAPFQVEVQNLMQVLGNQVKNKEWGTLLKFVIAAYGFNEVAKKIRGSGVTFDPIDAVIDAANTYQEEDDKKIGAIRAGGRLSGELLSNVMFGQTLASLYPEYGIKIPGTDEKLTRKEFFGDEDPTRFGSGLLALKGIQDPLYKLLPGFGGQQIEKTIEGAKSYAKGYSENESGNVQYPIAKTSTNLLKSLAFGKSSTPEAQKYYKSGTTPLGDVQSEIFKTGAGADYYNKIINTRQADKQADKEVAQIKSGKITQAADLGSGIYQLSNGKFYVDELGKTLDSESKVKKYLFEKELGDYSTVKAQYQLDYQRAKRKNDIESYIKYSQDYLAYLYSYKDILDPETDKKELINILNEIDDVEYYLSKYMSYGGFTKGSGGGSGKKKIPTLSMPESVTSLQRIPIRQAKKPTFSTGKISVKAPQVRKLPVKGITKEYLSKLR